MLRSIVRGGVGPLLLLSIVALVACDASEVTGPEVAPTVVFGQIASSATVQPAGPATGSHVSLADIVVSTEDGSSSTTTDDHGAFRLEVKSDHGRVRLRFRRGALDIRLELSGLPEGGIFQIDLSLGDDEITVLASTDSDEADFDGIITGLSISGATPARIAVLQVEDDDEAYTVQVLEAETTFDRGKDITDFGMLLDAMSDASILLEVDGEGRLQADGTIVAKEIEVEVEEAASDDDSEEDENDDADDDSVDDDVNDPADFSGSAALVSVTGAAPARTARIEVTNLAGTTTIDVVEGTTVFDALGDALSFEAMLTALMTDGLAVEIEGDGELQADGTVVATSVKVETDGDDDVNDPADFSGTAALVSVTGAAPARTARIEVTNLAGTTTIDVVEGTTVFDALGDALSFEAMLAALMTDGLAVEIEGDGELQADGTVVATSVKVETDG